MFATWKYDRDTSEVHNIRLAFDPISARSSQHQACDRCHEKKVRRTWNPNACLYSAPLLQIALILLTLLLAEMQWRQGWL